MRWKQRDLEDQIKEEYEAKGKVYIQNVKKEKQNEMKQVKIEEVVSLLKKGYVRWKRQETESGKSIQSHYGLTFTECQEVFAHEKVKGVKTKVKTLEIIDESTVKAVTLKTEEEVKESPSLEETVENLFK